MPTIRRTLKNVVKNYSDAQVKVREATSNDPWGPSSTLMSEIADFTYNVIAFTEIMQMIWKRLNDDGKNWRHVYKSLVLLDYIVKTGSEKVAQQCKENFHAVKTLTSFQYIDTDNKDQGMNVREKAKQLVQLLSDEERLKNERAKAMKAKERMAQNAMGVGNRETNGRRMGAASPSLGGGGGGGGGSGGYTDYGAAGYDSSPSSGDRRPSSELDSARPASVGEEELQLQLALAMSKEDYDEELRRQKSDDIKLQMAIAESRRQAEEEPQASGSSLLDLDPEAPNGAHAKDPWGVPLQQKPDPWGTPVETPPAPKADPWGSPAPTAKPQQSSPVPPQASPWGGPVSSSSKQSTPGSQPDPWVSSPAAQSPWEAPVQESRSNTANGTSNLDSEFDLLSSRSENTSPSVRPGGSSNTDAFDPLDGFGGASGGDAWGMGSMQQALPPEENKKKKAEDFLGANAGLVNLDQLVAKAPAKGNNPFAAGPSTSNPFVQPTTRVPMNQLQNTAPGFSQPVATGLLPTPLMPVNTTTPPVQPQGQGYNPFL